MTTFDRASRGSSSNAWSPTLTNLNIGSTGSQSGYWRYSNGVLHCWWHCILGGTGISVGDVEIDVPSGFELGVGTFRHPLGTAQLVDSTTGYAGIVRFLSLTSVGVRRTFVTGSTVRYDAISSTLPFTWAAGDAIGIEFHAPATYSP